MEKTESVCLIVVLCVLCLSTSINATTNICDDYYAINRAYISCGNLPQNARSTWMFEEASSQAAQYVEGVCFYLDAIKRCIERIVVQCEPSVKLAVMSDFNSTYNNDICQANGWVHRYLLPRLSDGNNRACFNSIRSRQICYVKPPFAADWHGSDVIPVTEGLVRQSRINDFAFTCGISNLRPAVAEINECDSATWLELFMTALLDFIVRPGLGQKLSMENIQQLGQEVEDRLTMLDVAKAFRRAILSRRSIFA